MPSRLHHNLIRNESGAALVEFTMLLPILLLLFATIIEGGRMMWSYQTAISGVREAARYVSRITGSDLCQPPNPVPPLPAPALSATLLPVVTGRVATPGTSGFLSVMPSGITVNSVSASFTCVDEGLRVSPTPLVTVTASVTITFPFADLIEFAGGSRPTLTTTISDQSRVFGS